MTAGRSLSLLLTACLAICIPVGLVGSAAAAPVLALGQPIAATAPVGPLAQLGACLQQRKVGDVLFVIDRSSSLQDTDPTAARVTGAQLVLARLAAESADSGIKLSVAVAGFDASLRTESDWTPLNAATAGSVSAGIANFASQNQGIETDYWTALGEARTKLSQHAAAAVGTKPCQTMLLFTDGRYQLQVRDTAALRAQYGVTKPIPGVQSVKLFNQAAVDQVIAAGRTDICRAGGIADELRSDGVTLVAVGLQSSAQDGTDDFSLLQQITENSQHNCGQQPANGYLATGDVNNLIFSFNPIGDPLNPPQPVDPKGVCRLTECPQQAHTFPLDASIKKINLLGAVNADGVDAYLKLPGQNSLPLPYSNSTRQLTVGDTRLTVHWLDRRSLSIDASYGGPTAWSGTWSLTFVDPTGSHPNAVSQTQLTISADLQAELAAPTTPARAGETATMAMQLIRRDGTPTSLGQPAPSVQVSIGATAVGSTDGPLTVLDKQPVTSSTSQVQWAIPADFPGTQASLIVVLSVETIGHLRLQDAVTSITFPVAPPVGYPHLSASSVAFPLASGRKPVHAVLSVAGPGCVWADGSTMQAFPAGTDGTVVTATNGTSAHCLALSGNQSGLLRLTLKPGGQGNGDMRGRITIHLAPSGHLDRAQQVTVTFTGSQQRLPNSSVQIGAFIFAMLLGVGIPIMLLLGLRRLAARFPAFTPSSVLVDVLVSGTSLSLADGGSAPAVTAWRDDPEITGSRRETSLSGLTVRARAGLRLQEAGYAVVTGAGFGVGSQSPHQVTRDHAPVLPLQLRGGWALLFDPAAAGDRVRGRLLLVVGPKPTPAEMAQEMSEVFRAAMRDAPELVRPLLADRGDGGSDGQAAGTVFVASPAPEQMPARPFQDQESGPWESGFGASNGGSPFGSQNYPAGGTTPGPFGNPRGGQ